MEFADIFAELVKQSRPSVVSADPVSCDLFAIIIFTKSRNRLKELAPFDQTKVVRNTKTTASLPMKKRTNITQIPAHPLPH